MPLAVAMFQRPPISGSRSRQSKAMPRSRKVFAVASPEAPAPMMQYLSAVNRSAPRSTIAHATLEVYLNRLEHRRLEAVGGAGLADKVTDGRWPPARAASLAACRRPPFRLNRHGFRVNQPAPAPVPRLAATILYPLAAGGTPRPGERPSGPSEEQQV